MVLGVDSVFDDPWDFGYNDKERSCIKSPIIFLKTFFLYLGVVASVLVSIEPLKTLARVRNFTHSIYKSFAKSC